MLSNLTLNDSSGSPVTLHEQVGSPSQTSREVVTAQGLWGIPTPRSTLRKRPTGHGEINETRWSDGSKIALTGQIASQVSIDAVWADFYTVTAPMVQTLDVGPALLKWTNGINGAQLQKAVVLDGEIDPVAQEGAALIDYQVAFHAPDPRAYAQSLTTVTSPSLTTAAGGLVFPAKFPWLFTPSSGGVAACTNIGNRPSPCIFRIFGYCQAPQLILLGSGNRISLANGTIAAGDYCDVIVGGPDAPSLVTKSVLYNGTVNRLNFLDSPNTTWFELPKGSSSVQLIASAFDSNAKVSAMFRSAYA